jgi:hypothetical protein
VVFRRIQMSSQTRAWAIGVMVLALGLAAGCSSGNHHNGTAATPTGGDPAIYAAAVSEIQSYLTMEVEHGPYAAAAAYLVADEQASADADTTWPAPSADPQTPVLIAGSVYSYEPWSWTSADQFTLAVILDLHFQGDPAHAGWYEGHNGQLITFSRPTPQTRWRMYFATGP